MFLLADVAAFLGLYLDALGLLLLAAVSPALVLAFLLFLDRVEPEPADGRWHAFLWGMFVAGSVAGVVNGIVEFEFGPLAALLIAAPLGEELLKGVGILWAVKRGEIDDALDGAIYAGWVAVGFTIAEDFVYYLIASDDGTLLETITFRAAGSSAPPLFTVWIGIAVGRAVAERTNIASAAAKGLAVATGLHLIWNFTTTIDMWFVAFLAFVGLAAGTVVYLRRHEKEFRHDVSSAAKLVMTAAQTSLLSPMPLALLERAVDPLLARELRLTLRRRARRALDAERTAIVRLLLRVRRAGVVYPAEILDLGDHLAEVSRIASGGRAEQER